LKYLQENSDLRSVSRYVTPERNSKNLLFAIKNGDINPLNLYREMSLDFDHTLDRIGKGSRENDKLRARRKITLHSFRRYVKTMISDLGYSDFSEYFIGHSGSTYYTKSEKDIIKMFEKIEPYLTFLDYEELVDVIKNFKSIDESTIYGVFELQS